MVEILNGCGGATMTGVFGREGWALLWTQTIAEIAQAKAMRIEYGRRTAGMVFSTVLESAQKNGLRSRLKRWVVALIILLRVGGGDRYTAREHSPHESPSHFLTGRCGRFGGLGASLDLAQSRVG